MLTVEKVGQAILDTMVGMSINEFSFKPKNQVVTLAAKTLVTTKYDVIQIDPQLLFQRISVIASKKDDPSTALKYELCSYPASLFESTVLLKEANKSDHSLNHRLSQIPCRLLTFTVCLIGDPLFR